MQTSAIISPLSLVRAQDEAQVELLLSAEEEKLIALIASIAVDQTIKQAYEESDSLSQV
jgi:hypothetical protein